MFCKCASLTTTSLPNITWNAMADSDWCSLQCQPMWEMVRDVGVMLWCNDECWVSLLCLVLSQSQCQTVARLLAGPLSKSPPAGQSPHSSSHYVLTHGCCCWWWRWWWVVTSLHRMAKYFTILWRELAGNHSGNHCWRGAMTAPSSQCCSIDYQWIWRKLLGQTESVCSDSVEVQMKDDVWCRNAGAGE